MSLTPASSPLPSPPSYIARSSSTGSTTSSQSQSATSISSSDVSVHGQGQLVVAAPEGESSATQSRGRRSSISKSIYQGYEDEHPQRLTPLVLPPTDMTVSANIHFEDDAHMNQHPAGGHYYSRPSSPTLGPTSSPALVSTTSTILEDFHHSHQNHYIVSLPPPQPSSSSSSPFSFFANSIASSSSPASPMIGSSSEHNAGSSSSNGGPASHHFPASTSSSKTLRIELAQPDVVLMTGQVTTLEGVLYVNVHKPTKVKTLQLEFSGRSSVTWIDDNAYSPATRHTTAPHIEHTWDFITHQHKQPSELLQTGQHAYPFALELPDTLPETLTTTHGKVSYRLTATLTKPGFSLHSSTITMPITLLRKYPSLNARNYQRGGRAMSKPEDKVQYKIVVPQTRVPHSTKVPLQVSITAPGPRVQVNVLQVGLWERVVYKADGRRRVDMRLVKIQKSEGWAHEGRSANGHEATTWNKVLLFDMPMMGGSDLTHCNPSADNGLMKVNHTLRFSILGLEGTKRFRAESEVDVKVLAFEDEILHRQQTIVMEDGTVIHAPDGEGDEGMVDPELPSYLISFTTPRVSFDAERDMDPVMADDDLLRSMLANIHLPTYAESEEDVNSRGTSRNVSRVVSRAPSRAQSPERLSMASPGPSTSVSHSMHFSAASAHSEGHQHPNYHHHHHHSNSISSTSSSGSSSSNSSTNNQTGSGVGSSTTTTNASNSGNQDGSGLLSVHHSLHHHPHHYQSHSRASSPLRTAV
ncbi:hypothetical protein DFQ27_005960 [Actinomortierella ambigua]|uniref:Arrestin C-terminal-like domain-containing protein n=1 Tax=Actinomortierella ambigua TaxID=1343610 RepID=A0A9P6PXB6_9FUNG|nr:hypothetical protein DFQ27_005960 [Actinomortierella ambigua]